MRIGVSILPRSTTSHLLGLEVQQAVALDELAAARPFRQPLVVDGNQRELRRHLCRRVRLPAYQPVAASELAFASQWVVARIPPPLPGFPGTVHLTWMIHPFWQADPVRMPSISAAVSLNSLTARRVEPELQVRQQRLGLGVVLGLELQALGVEAREVGQDAGLQRHNSMQYFMLVGEPIWPAISAATAAGLQLYGHRCTVAQLTELRAKHDDRHAAKHSFLNPLFTLSVRTRKAEMTRCTTRISIASAVRCAEVHSRQMT
jgi:hypothetical protein